MAKAYLECSVYSKTIWSIPIKKRKKEVIDCNYKIIDLNASINKNIYIHVCHYLVRWPKWNVH
jgi:hypothetical protein